MLLADGRVMNTGGAGGGSLFGDDNRIEAYEPPYLFRGVRPRIDSISTTNLVLGGSFSMGAIIGKAMSEQVIKIPSETILFGEKETSSGHYYMDMLEGVGNDFTEVEQSRHSATTKNSGGSNFAFADGSIRYLRFGQMLTPQNLWVVEDAYRNAMP
jgi:prepilin-type processing-associated H-X9-DG protein